MIQLHQRSILFLLAIFFTALFALGQEEEDYKIKFGGPFTTISFNKLGPSLSAGGGGVFLASKNFYAGIFGQGTTSAFVRTSKILNQEYSLKSRQTGVWIGYSKKFKSNSKVRLTFYNKIGVGKVYLENSKESLSYYNSTIVFTPNIEISYQLFYFLELGLSTYYEFFTKVDLYGLNNSDLNAYGVSFLMKFRGSN